MVDEKTVRRLSDARDREREGKEILSLPGEVAREDAAVSRGGKINRGESPVANDGKRERDSAAADDPERLGEKIFISNEALWIIQSKKNANKNAQQNPLVARRKASVAAQQDSGIYINISYTHLSLSLVLMTPFSTLFI